MNEFKPFINIPVPEETEAQLIKKLLTSFIPCSACKKLGWDLDCKDRCKCGDHMYIKMQLHFLEESRK